MQEGDPLGRVLPDVLHEGHSKNLRVDLTTSTITKRMVQCQTKANASAHTAKSDLNSQRGGMTKDLGNFASSSVTKSKNKPSKKRNGCFKKETC